MNDEKVYLSKKDHNRGEDGYKTFSVRIKQSTLLSLEILVKQTGRSRNELINILLEFGIGKVEISE